jgi:hypothetical protein
LVPDNRRAHEILAAIEKAGWSYGAKSAARTLGAHTGIVEVYDLAERKESQSGLQAVYDLLTVIDRTWPDNPLAAAPWFQAAVAEIMREYGAFTDAEIKELQHVDLGLLKSRANEGGGYTGRRDVVCRYLYYKVLGKRKRGDLPA